MTYQSFLNLALQSRNPYLEDIPFMRNLKFKALMLMATLVVFSGPVLAQEAAKSTQFSFGEKKMGLGALAVAIAAFAGALGDGRAIAAACEGTARNPGAGGRIFTAMVLGLALIETLTLVTFAAAFLGL